MTKDKIKEAVEFYEKCLLGYRTNRYTADKKILNFIENKNSILEHCQYMISEIKTFLKQNRIEKSFRWLGFIQGCLWTAGIFSIDQIKDHNRP